MMKIMLSVIGILLALVGLVWILQGANVLGGSVMSGQSQWTIYGAISAVIGITLLVIANRRSATRPRN
jgi:hypothetical protein